VHTENSNAEAHLAEATKLQDAGISSAQEKERQKRGSLTQLSENRVAIGPQAQRRTSGEHRWRSGFWEQEEWTRQCLRIVAAEKDQAGGLGLVGDPK
jgi:hypothetical protein